MTFKKCDVEDCPYRDSEGYCMLSESADDISPNDIECPYYLASRGEAAEEPAEDIDWGWGDGVDLATLPEDVVEDLLSQEVEA